MQMQRQFVFIPCLRHGSRVPRTGQRAVTSFAADSSQQTPGFDEVLEAGTVIGSATFDILVEEAVEVAADASRIQAEQLRILSRLPEDPQGSFNELLQDIQSREIPSVSDVMHRAASVMVCFAASNVIANAKPLGRTFPPRADLQQCQSPASDFSL